MKLATFNCILPPFCKTLLGKVCTHSGCGLGGGRTVDIEVDRGMDTGIGTDTGGPVDPGVDRGMDTGVDTGH